MFGWTTSQFDFVLNTVVSSLVSYFPLLSVLIPVWRTVLFGDNWLYPQVQRWSMWTKLRSWVFQTLDINDWLKYGNWSKPDQSKWIWGKSCFCSFQYNVKLGTTAAIFTIIKKKKFTWWWINTSQKWSQIPLENVKLWIKPHLKSSLPLDFPVAWVNELFLFNHLELNFSFATKSTLTDTEIFKFYKVEAYPSRYMTQTVSTRHSKTKLKDRECV